MISSGLLAVRSDSLHADAVSARMLRITLLSASLLLPACDGNERPAAQVAGPMGTMGTQGPAGAMGATGATGATGAQGPMGVPGATGPAGATGATGPQGNDGPPGAVGPQGPAGPEGPAGPPLALPFERVQSDSAALFSLTNPGGAALSGSTGSPSAAAFLGRNTGGGEALVGIGNSAAGNGAVVGRNDGAGVGVRGFVSGDTSGTAVGVLGQVGLNNGTGSAGRFVNSNADNFTGNTLVVETMGRGDPGNSERGNAAFFNVSSTNSVAAGVRAKIVSIFSNFGAAAVYGESAGTGGQAGIFYASNPAGSGPALIAATEGNGIAISARAEGNGQGLFTIAEGSGAPLLAQRQSAGDLAVFRRGVGNAVNNVARIDGTGKGFFNGGTQVGGADVAEFVPTTGALPQVGDVVEIDPQHPDRFRISKGANNTRVAGVISTDPGVTLNARDGADAAVSGPALALVGRVPVKVTGEGGAIRIGDLLAASSTPGHAMRAPAAPAPGTIIGKALEHFDARDKGQVEMLVMLR